MFSSQLWFMRRLAIDTRLPVKVMEVIRQHGRLERWGHLARVYPRPGADEVYIVLGGAILLDDGAHLEAPARLLRGDVFGALVPTAFDRPDGQAPGIVAFDETTLCALPGELFRDLTREHLGTLECVVGGLRARQRLAIPVAPLLGTTPDIRVARVLVHLAEACGHIEGNAAVLPTPLRTRPIASLTGLDPRRTRLLLEHMRHEGLVSSGLLQARIADLERVRALALQL